MAKTEVEKRIGSKKKILAFFLANVGTVVKSRDIQEASGWVAEWGRRVRDLRNEDGYEILSHRDRGDLKPDEYLMPTSKRRPAFAREISKQTRALVLERNGYTCQMCGFALSDPDPYNPDGTVRITVRHIVEKDKGGLDDANNLRAVCNNCNEGLRNISPPSPDRLQLFTYVRKATRDDQLAVLQWLLTKFKDHGVK